MPASDDARLPIATESARPRSSRLARVLIGYDGSDCADAAAAFGLWLAGLAALKVIARTSSSEYKDLSIASPMTPRSSAVAPGGPTQKGTSSTRP